MKVRILDQVFTQEEYEVMTFDEVMDILCEHDEINSEESLKDYVKYLIDKKILVWHCIFSMVFMTARMLRGISTKCRWVLWCRQALLHAKRILSTYWRRKNNEPV